MAWAARTFADDEDRLPLDAARRGERRRDERVDREGAEGAPRIVATERAPGVVEAGDSAGAEAHGVVDRFGSRERAAEPCVEGKKAIQT